MIAEVSDTTNAILIKVNSKPGGPNIKPLSIDRPGKHVEPPEAVTGFEMESSIAALGGKIVRTTKRTKERSG